LVIHLAGTRSGFPYWFIYSGRILAELLIFCNLRGVFKLVDEAVRGLLHPVYRWFNGKTGLEVYSLQKAAFESFVKVAYYLHFLPVNHSAMHRNYLRIAWRNLLKYKTFSLINAFGLAIGMAACLLIVEYVQQERSFDRFHQQQERIFRVQLDSYHNGRLEYQSAVNYPAVGPAMKQELPEVESFVRLNSTTGLLTRQAEAVSVLLQPNQVYYTEEDFFSVFSFSLLAGSKTALNEPNTILLANSLVRKLFDNASPLGKTLHFKRGAQNTLYTVKGVFEDVPANSHLQFQALLSYPTLVAEAGERAQNAWWWYDFYTYVLLRPGVDAAQLQAKLPTLVEKYKGEELRKSNRKVSLVLQPLADIHLSSALLREASVNGNGSVVQLLPLVAALLLLLAWINYVNLSTARATERAREVGVRKAIGASYGQLVKQFLLEAALLNGLALLLAFGLYQLGSLLLKQWVPIQLPLKVWSYWQLAGSLLALYILGVLGSGLYPAFILSRFKPLPALKGSRERSPTGGVRLRKALVVFQFAIALALLTSTFALYQQNAYMQGQALGFTPQQVLVVNAPLITQVDSVYVTKLAAFKEQLLQHPAISHFTLSNNVPGKENRVTVGQIRRLEADPVASNTYQIVSVDEDFLATFGIELLAGRGFSRQFSTDKEAVLLNETALGLLGFESPKEAIGQRISFWGERTVVGVVKDYHHLSLRHAYAPLIFTAQPLSLTYFSLKVNTANLPGIIRTIGNEYKRFFPGNSFAYFFLDDQFAKQYEAEEQAQRLFTVFSGLIVLVACLGLFALTSYSVSQRTKEIGIRKVLGASVGQLISLLGSNLFGLLLLATVLAWPLAYYAVRIWLEKYPFRMEMHWGLFVIPALVVALISLLTVSKLTLKAARANPVDGLRSE
jgi:putative ABC transport system permease protein